MRCRYRGRDESGSASPGALICKIVLALLLLVGCSTTVDGHTTTSGPTSTSGPASDPNHRAPVSWRVVNSPQSSGHPGNELSGVSCVGSKFCVAVGTNGTGPGNAGNTSGPQIPYFGKSETLVQMWTGSEWSTTRSPTPGAKKTVELDDVSCTSPVFCVAVGRYTPSSGSGADTLVESWEGRSWSQTDSPNAANNVDANFLSGVSCVSTSFCVAVGRSELAGSGEGPYTLIESWDGSAWNQVDSPNPGGSYGGSQLSDVSCLSPTSCTAVGYINAVTNGRPHAMTLVESWDGSTWSQVASPSLVDASGATLSGVSCVSATFCVTVGESIDNKQSTYPLIEGWDGKQWSEVDRGGLNGGSLSDVSCDGATACTAVGSDRSSGTLVDGFDGANWTRLKSPSPGSPGQSSLGGVSCRSGAACTAVGSYTRRDNGPLHTLIEQS